ncbi:MAG: glycosyltransferase [Candidatus Eisenbacteria bacterium]
MESVTALAAAAWILYIYPYAVYPLVLRLLDRRTSKALPLGRRDMKQISHIICVHNEKQFIGQKISNCLEMKPTRPQEIIVVCDGCTDGTEEIAQRLAATAPTVKVLSIPHSGKTTAQNLGAREAAGEALIFSDADTLIPTSTVDALGDRLSEGYACVGADVRYQNRDTGDSLYIRLEADLKTREARRGVMIGVQGGCYAVAAEDFVELGPPVLSDLIMPLEMLLRGGAVTFESEAKAYKASKYPDLRSNIARRRRIFSRALGTLFREGYLARIARKPRLLFYLVSDKLLRYFIGPLLVLAIVLTVLAIPRSYLPVAGFVSVILLLGAAIISALSGTRQLSRSRLAGACGFFITVNVASLLSLADYALGKDYSKW